MNYTGFFKRLPAVIPEDNKNLNRVFPGDKDGTLSEKIAYNFSKYLYPNIDFFFDLHGGDVQENVTPFVYFSGSADEEVKKISMRSCKITFTPLQSKIIFCKWCIQLSCHARSPISSCGKGRKRPLE